MLDEFYRIAFRKKLYRTIAELQADLDKWLRQYNEVRTHQGRWCYGETPMQTFLDTLPMAREELIDQQSQPAMLIPEQVAHLFRNDVAHLFRDDRAQRSDLIPPALPG